MYACIDLGSNSFHLLIGEWQDDRIRIIERCSEKVQLGEGVPESGEISPQAFKRGMECLVRFEGLMALHGVTRYWALGTNTFRIAGNAGDFTAAAAEIGIEISIISGVQEAVLVYSGVVSDLPPSDRNRLVIDIGGGSTELIVGVHKQRLITHSLPVGCVSWRDHYFSAQETASKAELDGKMSLASSAAKSIFQSIAPGVRHYNWDEAYGSSGTAKMLTAICQEHGEGNGSINLLMLRRLRKKLLDTIAYNRQLPGLKEKRRDLLLPGFSIMEGLMEAISCNQIIFSSTALREGMLDFIVRSNEPAHSLDLSRFPGISSPGRMQN